MSNSFIGIFIYYFLNVRTHSQVMHILQPIVKHEKICDDLIEIVSLEF